MNQYDFSFKQEVLMEKGACVLGDLFNYRRANGLMEKNNPFSLLYGIIWQAKQDILTANTESELSKIEGQFDLANRFLAESDRVYDR